MTKTNLTAKVETITPDLALEMLGNNENNRNLRNRAVTLYARDMIAGNWSLNGEAIKIDTDGCLVDGQHRLNAIIAADVPVQMLVVRGLPSGSGATVDLGLRRQTKDMLDMQGEQYATIMGAVLRRLCLRERGIHMTSGAFAPPTMAEMLDLLDRRPEIRRSCEVAVLARVDRILPPSATATAHFLMNQISPTEAAWFFDRLGDDDLTLGHPIRVLRQKVTASRLAGHRPNTDECLAYLIVTWNLYRRGRSKVSYVRLPVGGLTSETYPKPR